MKNTTIFSFLLFFGFTVKSYSQQGSTIDGINHYYGSGTIEEWMYGDLPSVEFTDIRCSAGYFELIFDNAVPHHVVSKWGVTDFSQDYVDYNRLSIWFESNNEYYLLNEQNDTICELMLRLLEPSLDSISVNQNERIKGDTVKVCSKDTWFGLNINYYYKADSSGTELIMKSTCRSEDDYYLDVYVNGIKESSKEFLELNLATGDTIQFKRRRGSTTCKSCYLGQNVDELVSKKYFVLYEQSPIVYDLRTENDDTLICPGERVLLYSNDSNSIPDNVNWFVNGSWDGLFNNEKQQYSYYPTSFHLFEHYSPLTSFCPNVSNDVNMIANDTCRGNVSGIVYLDGSWATKLANVKVRSNKGHVAITDSAGKFSMFFDKSEKIDSIYIDDIRYKKLSTSLYYSIPDFLLVSSISLKAIPNRTDDLAIFCSSGRNRPGFTIPYFTTVKNYGKTSKTVDVAVELPADLTYVSNDGEFAPDSVDGNKLFWLSKPIEVGSDFFIPFFAKLDRGTTLGKELNVISYLSNNSDEVFNNDTSLLKPIVTGSYDPNDKNAEYNGPSNGTFIHDSTQIEYTIRFQNTGTDTAFTVVVKDNISSSLSIQSVEMVGASHNYSLSIKNDSLIWTFTNILLVDSNANEAASHGFVKFKIDQSEGNSEGMQIKNKAFIYFDFNDPIITNEHISEINYGIVTSVVELSNGINVYPNPNNGVFFIDNIPNGEIVNTVEVFNTMGNSIKKIKWSNTKNEIAIPEVAVGTYFINVRTNKSVYIGRIIKE